MKSRVRAPSVKLTAEEKWFRDLRILRHSFSMRHIAHTFFLSFFLLWLLHTRVEKENLRVTSASFSRKGNHLFALGRVEDMLMATAKNVTVITVTTGGPEDEHAQMNDFLIPAFMLTKLAKQLCHVNC